MTLSEAGTHAVLDARIGGLNRGELELATPLADAARDMLVLGVSLSGRLRKSFGG
ncbi:MULTISPECIES: hypothetical protein [Kitasatospora]|uniref:hypothetical protein n=1 Tax=Kitasatospora TaxID=2063 RepID=UPI003CD096F7